MDTNKVNNICLIILAAFAITVGLIFMKPALIPFVFSIFIYFLALPVMQYFEDKMKLPKALAIFSTAFLFITTISLMFALIISSLDQFVSGVEQYKNQVLSFVKFINDKLVASPIPIDAQSLLDQFKDLPFMSAAKQFTGGLFSFFGNLLLVIIFVLFLLAGEGVRGKHNKWVNELEFRISKYIALKGLVSTVTAFITWMILLIVGADLAFMFAVLTFLLNFIPNIGSMVAVALPIPVLLLQYGFGWQVIAFFVAALATQFSIGNVIEPKLMGDSMDLHPVAILFFLMFWGLVWGVAGMFLAVPITAILKMILSKIPATRRLSELLAGRL